MAKKAGDTQTESSATAAAYLPPERTIEALQAAARGCRGCGLYAHATQTVFGTGPKTARMVLVGEQPGNDEDLAGAPFVGPAGRILDEALKAAGIARSRTYVTNAVKHFKWTPAPRGKRRLHSKPSAGETTACSPWLEQELAIVDPDVIVCLGATAAQALLGRKFRLTAQRGTLLTGPEKRRVLATIHPSFVLRQRSPEERQRLKEVLIADLKIARDAMS